MKISAEDVLWEAVRRNEDFKKDCLEFHEKQKTETNKMINYYRMDMRIKWLIDTIPEDCNLDVDKIHELIKNNEKSFDHPYHNTFPFEKQAVFYNDLSEIKIVSRRFKDMKKPVYVVEGKARILKNFLRDSRGRIIVSIEPSANDRDIEKSIKEIKNDYRIRFNEKYGGEDRRVVFSPNKLSSYISWLKEYDAFVAYILKDPEKYEPVVVDGAYLLKDMINFPFDELIDKEAMKKKKKEEIKNYLGMLLEKQPEFKDIKKKEMKLSKIEKRNLAKLENSDLPELIMNLMEGYNESQDAYLYLHNQVEEKEKDGKIDSIISNENIIINSDSNEEKRIEESINGAIQLIQAVPKIKFGFKRTKKKN